MLAGTAVGEDDDWLRCGPTFRIPERPPLEAAGSDAEPGTLHLSADAVEGGEEGVSRFSGNVTVGQDSRRLRSDEIVYDESEEVIDAGGNVMFWDEGVFVASEGARANVGDDIVTFTHATSFMLESEHGHGDAAEIRAFGNKRLTATDATYTTCDPGKPDWRITAREVDLDRDGDVGIARDTWLEFKGRRVFHLPWISFPLSDRRKSGFLTPTFGTSGSGGVEFAVPYYFNLAPNRDATVTARAMSARGMQAQGEFRFLSRRFGSGRLTAEHLPHDPKFGGDRTSLSFAHNHRWTDRWSTDTRFEWLSDGEYLEDFGASLSRSSRTHLPRTFDANYRGDGWDALVRFQDFMILDRTVQRKNRPYARLPRITAGTNRPERNRAPNFGLKGEITYFDDDSRTTGTRLDLQPSLTWPYRSAEAFVTPKAALHATGYRLNRQAADAGLDDAPSRVVPSFSIDSGLFLERPLTIAGAPFVQTIEPRLFYLLVPHERQDDLPLFDTAVRTFSFAQLFRENRYAGRDRIGDANQVTVALTSRLLDDRRVERASASIGQIRYLRDLRVSLDDEKPETGRTSDLVAELEVRPTRAWRLRTGLQYDADANRTERNVLKARYQPDPRSVVNVGYRLVRKLDAADAIEQADLSFAWPIGANWRTVGRWLYALNAHTNRTLEAFFGVEYQSCCWGFRFVARRFRTGDARDDVGDDYSNGVYLQLELKGLTATGNTAEAFLTHSIPGYENEF